MIRSILNIFQIKNPVQDSSLMKLILQSRDHQPSDSFHELVEAEINALGTQVRIDEARMLIEHLPESSPPFRVSAHLVTPGPDLMAKASDHTLRAAFAKVIRQLAGSIVHRSGKGKRKIRSKISGRAVPLS
jgi:ribosome-associated translation inhibitor RaiA